MKNKFTPEEWEKKLDDDKYSELYFDFWENLPKGNIIVKDIDKFKKRNVTTTEEGITYMSVYAFGVSPRQGIEYKVEDGILTEHQRSRTLFGDYEDLLERDANLGFMFLLEKGILEIKEVNNE